MMKVLPEITEKLQESMLKEFIRRKKDFIFAQEESLIISEDNYLQPSVIVQNIMAQENEFYCRENSAERTSILIVTKSDDLMDFILGLKTPVEDVLEYSRLRGAFLRGKNIFCDMNDATFACVYWKDILYRYFDGNIPKEIPLNYIFPLAKGRKNFKTISRGEKNKIGRKDNKQKPVFVISDILATGYDAESKFDHIFIDGRTVKKPIEVNRITAPYTIFFDTYFDYRLPYLSTKTRGFYPLKTMYFSSLSIHLVESPFNEELNQAFQKLDKLRAIKFNAHDLKIIWRILRHIVRTPIEGVEYDLIAKFDYNQETIKDMLKDLIDSEYRYENTDFEDLIKIIEDIYNKYDLDRESPKFVEIEKWIEKASKRRSRMLILVDGKIETMGLREKLALKFNVDISELESKNIEISNYQNAHLLDENNYEEVLVTSLTNIKDLSILEKNLSQKVDFILYKVELRETKKTLKSLLEVNNRLIETGLSNVEETIYTRLYNKFRSADNERETMASLSINDLSDSILSLPESYAYRLQKPYQGNNAVTAKLVLFEDGPSTFLKLTDKVNFRKKDGSKLETKVMTELEEGDDLVLIDGDVREDLYNVFIKSVNSGNTSKKHFEVVKKWRELYENKFVHLKLDDNELFNLMRLNGWNKTSKGILENWRTGYSYGPRDQEDIKILGLILKIPEFIENPEYYYNSMNYIRSEARVAARLLNKIIHYSEKKINSNDNAFLSKYQLTIEEVQSAVHVKKIKSISIVEYMVKPKEVGKIFDEREEVK